MQNAHIETIPLNHDTVAFHAYLLWEKAGRPAGQDKEYWLQAELQLRDATRRDAATLKAAALSSLSSAQPRLEIQPAVQPAPRRKRKVPAL